VTLVTLGLALVAGAGGCRSGRPEVPPEQPYLPPSPALGAQAGPGAAAGPRVGFSSEPPAGGSPYAVAAAADNPYPPGMAPAPVAGANEAVPAIGGQPAYGTVPGTAAYNAAVAPAPGDPAARPAAAAIPGPDPLQGLPAMGPGGAAEPPR
jgi:cytoskeleton protein RodZ